jgi:citrate/tricarballylate utilization protein
MHADDATREGERILTICNACRYCEGYCAVFPAMERRLTFAAGDLDYLANLCHDCGECYDACQYAPPHEFAVNVPQTLAAIRSATWRRHAWPGWLAPMFDRPAWSTVLLVAAGMAILVLTIVTRAGASRMPAAGADFYAVLPHAAMVLVFGVAGLYVLLALAIGFVRFSRSVGEPLRTLLAPGALAEALRDTAGLRYLNGGGTGCAHPDLRFTSPRRWLHHFTFYGFVLCFAATIAGTVYHYAFGWPAPYAYVSLPVLLGTMGGIGLLIGPAGHLWLRKQDGRVATDGDQQRMNVVLNVLLLLTSASGLALLAWRDSGAMPALLVVHLASVLALFLSIPHGKLVHALYRLAALARFALERRRPRLDVGGDA